eukprot:5840150-Amphidinium_carterae.1
MSVCNRYMRGALISCHLKNHLPRQSGLNVQVPMQRLPMSFKRAKAHLNCSHHMGILVQALADGAA